MPATRLSARRLIVFSEKPIRSMNQKVGIADSGVASAEMIVALKSRRNRKTTSTASTAPSIIAWRADSNCCRSEEHTSELQSLMRISYAVFCLKKKHKLQHHTKNTNTHT